jgi:hypothetical protein
MVGLAEHPCSLRGAEMSKRAKRLQRPLTDQEVLEHVTQKAGWYFYIGVTQLAGGHSGDEPGNGGWPPGG